MNRVPSSFQMVRPSRTEFKRPVDAMNLGTTVASAEGETKLPVMLTMVTEGVHDRGGRNLSLAVEKKGEPA